MERLTKRYIDFDGNDCVTSSKGNNSVSCIYKLADYEDTGLTPEQIIEIDRLYAEKCTELAECKKLEEQGLLLKLPCRVGDTYYCIDDGTYPNEWEFTNLQQIISVMDKIGKTVFLTQAEAEEALKGMEGEAL